MKGEERHQGNGGPSGMARCSELRENGWEQGSLPVWFRRLRSDRGQVKDSQGMEVPLG